MKRDAELILNQVTIPVRDVARATAFYRGLGLIVVVDGPDYARLVAPGNGATLSLDRTAGHTRGGTVVYFECAALDDEVRNLESKGFVFDRAPEDRRWLWREAYLRDPEGNTICLYYAGDNRLNPPWRVPVTDSRHILSRERFEAWLNRFFEAKVAADPDAMGRLFAADARYFETPFAEPLTGPEQIAQRCARSEREHQIVGCDLEIVQALDRRGFARWRTCSRRPSHPISVRRDGVVEVAFDPEGLATEVRQWWHQVPAE